MDLRTDYPFDGLRLGADESVLWAGSNPTFHRASEYGLVVTCRAFHYRRYGWSLIRRWQRIDLKHVIDASATRRMYRAMLALTLDGARAPVIFRGPIDAYQDEVDYDYETFCAAADMIRRLVRQVPGSASAA